MAKLIICIVRKTKPLKVPFESTSWLKRLSPPLGPLLAALHSVYLACISQTCHTSNASAVTPVTATIFSLKNKKRGDALPTDKPTKLQDFRHACTEHSAHDDVLPSAPEQHSRGQLRVCSRHRLSQEHHHDKRKKGESGQLISESNAQSGTHSIGESEPGFIPTVLGPQGKLVYSLFPFPNL